MPPLLTFDASSSSITFSARRFIFSSPTCCCSLTPSFHSINRPSIATFHPLRSAISLSASLLLLSNSAQAATIKMGADDGTLVFVPSSLSVPAGEKIVFVNNKGFPHNIIFQKDGVPEGVQADAISHEDYLNEPGEQYVLTLKEKGAYMFFCHPHRDAKMFGVITVT